MVDVADEYDSRDEQEEQETQLDPETLARRAAAMSFIRQFGEPAAAVME